MISSVSWGLAFQGLTLLTWERRRVELLVFSLLHGTPRATIPSYFIFPTHLSASVPSPHLLIRPRPASRVCHSAVLAEEMEECGASPDRNIVDDTEFTAPPFHLHEISRPLCYVPAGLLPRPPLSQPWGCSDLRGDRDLWMIIPKLAPLQCANFCTAGI